MGDFKSVAVLKGGPSSERDVSLRSGAAVAKGLREAGYDVIEVDVTAPRLDLPDGIDAVFIALHGTFGEDGGVQTLLDAEGIPYTGSGAEASRAAFDKLLSKRAFEAHGIRSPDYEVLATGDKRTLSLPAVVKPLSQGSSLGVGRVRTEQEWEGARVEAQRYGAEVLVERFVEGRELTVGLVDGEPLPVIEIVAPGGWYDYAAKYTAGATEYRVPAPISAEVTQRCQATALDVFRALGCRGVGRVDVRVEASGGVYVLELNSIPGFTETSLLPKAAAEAGMSFSVLCDRIMKTAAMGA